MLNLMFVHIPINEKRVSFSYFSTSKKYIANFESGVASHVALGPALKQPYINPTRTFFFPTILAYRSLIAIPSSNLHNMSVDLSELESHLSSRSYVEG